MDPSSPKVKQERPRPKPRPRPRPKPLAQSSSATPIIVKSDPDSLPNNDKDIQSSINDAHNIEEERKSPDEEETDEIIREIDVYISPALSSKLSLVQFPLHPRRIPIASSYHNSLQIPTKARLRPLHNKLELEYPLPTPQDTSRLSSLPSSISNLTHRTLQSHAVQCATHMAIGGWSSDGSSLYLTPLLSKSMYQMRPSFAHMDSPDTLSDEPTSTPQPIFRKTQSKAASASPYQRMSYAEQKAQEDEEDWAELQVYDKGTEEYHDKKGRLEQCQNVGMNLQFGNPNKDRQDNAATTAKDGRKYIQTLNYLPPAQGMMDLDMFDYTPPDEEGKETNTNSIVSENSQDQRYLHLLKSFASKITSQMVKSGGSPLPYKLLQSRYIPHSSQDDANDQMTRQAFVMGLSGSAVLVRGSSFVLKSSLMTWLHPSARELRDFILLVFYRDGQIVRPKLGQLSFLQPTATEETKELMQAHTEIQSQVIHKLLHQLAQKGMNCWKWKYEKEDHSFEYDYPKEAMKHYQHWERKMEYFRDALDEYDNIP